MPRTVWVREAACYPGVGGAVMETKQTRPQWRVASLLPVGTEAPHAAASEGQRHLPAQDSAARGCGWTQRGHFSLLFLPQVLCGTKGNGSSSRGILIHYDEISRIFEEEEHGKFTVEFEGKNVGF